MPLLAPSILNADLGNLSAILPMLEEEGVEVLHLDVMDGHFVPVLTFGPVMAKAIARRTKLLLEAHLMVTNPQDLIGPFVEAGCQRILVHPEGALHLDRLLQSIRQAGAQPGVVLNPATPLCVLDEVLPSVEMVLLMSVNPGFGGQAFIPYVVDKIKGLRERCAGLEKPPLIEVDGGIKVGTMPPCLEAGADVFVVGSAIFGADDPRAAVAGFQDLLRRKDR